MPTPADLAATDPAGSDPDGSGPAELDGEVFELEVGEVAGGGGCVARAPDGRVVFVRHSLPGERVRARVTEATSSFYRADAVEVLQASPDRVEPPCPHAGPGRCGGCDFQHVSLAAQRVLKATRVADQLQRLAGVTSAVEVEAVPGDQEGLRWRTRVRLAIDPDGRTGFRRQRSHDLVLVDDCPIAAPGVVATGAFGASWKGANEVEVVTGNARPDAKNALVSIRAGRDAKLVIPDIGAGLVLNGKVRRHPGAVTASVGGHDFRVSPGVFWQVHAGAAAALCEAVRDVLAARPGEKVADLYAGAGLFSVALADDVGPRGSVLAVERDRRACGDAEHNAVGYPQVKVKKASVTPRLVEQGLGSPDLVVLDPAREGAGQAVMAALASLSSSVRRLAYVSCDPSSFGRDARVLLDEGWHLTSLRAFDIFPMTEHVEMVACFASPSEAAATNQA